MNEALGAIKTTFGARSDVGRVRQLNEDSYLVDPKMQLFIVCDGMGGHAGGEIASATAVSVAHEVLSSEADRLRQFDGEDQAERIAILRLTERAIQTACQRIYERAQRNPEERGMGTTLTLILFKGGRAFIGHVGDSRAYLYRNNSIHQLTEDHSLIADMLKSGRIRSIHEVDPAFRNAVTRAVGVHPTVEVDTLDLPILPGDRFLLCSDGLTGYADLKTLLDFMTRFPNEEACCDRLISFANDAGGADNITVVMPTITETDTDDSRTERILEIASNLTLFRYLNHAELMRVMAIASERKIAQGQPIFIHGELGDEAFVILQGRVQIRSANVVIALLEEGRHFGEMSLVDNKPRAADAVAVEDCRLLVLSRGAFHDLMRRNPVFAVKMLWSFVKAMTGRLRYTTNELSLVKSLFQATNPDEADKLPAAWLPPDALNTLARKAKGPRTSDSIASVRPPPIPVSAKPGDTATAVADGTTEPAMETDVPTTEST